jgi:hypothetical protein
MEAGAFGWALNGFAAAVSIYCHALSNAAIGIMLTRRILPETASPWRGSI